MSAFLIFATNSLTHSLALVAAMFGRALFGRGFFGLGDANGGSNCATCTVLVALLEQSASVHNATIDEEVAKICTIFPAGVIQNACKAVVDLYGPEVINRLDAKVRSCKLRQQHRLTRLCRTHPTSCAKVLVCAPAPAMLSRFRQRASRPPLPAQRPPLRPRLVACYRIQMELLTTSYYQTN